MTDQDSRVMMNYGFGKIAVEILIDSDIKISQLLLTLVSTPPPHTHTPPPPQSQQEISTSDFSHTLYTPKSIEPS